jgi:hypothetical protein
MGALLGGHIRGKKRFFGRWPPCNSRLVRKIDRIVLERSGRSSIKAAEGYKRYQPSLQKIHPPPPQCEMKQPGCGWRASMAGRGGLTPAIQTGNLKLRCDRHMAAGSVFVKLPFALKRSTRRSNVQRVCSAAPQVPQRHRHERKQVCIASRFQLVTVALA